MEHLAVAAPSSNLANFIASRGRPEWALEHSALRS